MKMKQQIMTLSLVAAFFLSGCMGKTAATYYKEGNMSMEEGEFLQANTNFLQAIKKNPERAEYYIASGFALIGLEKFEEAVNQFDKAYSEKNNQVVRENNKALLRGKAIAKLRLGKLSESWEEFQKALQIADSPELNLDIKKYLALIANKSGNYQAAIELYESIMQEGKKDASSYFSLAGAYRLAGDKEKAIESFEEAIALDKDNFEAYFGEYGIYMELMEKEKAEEVLSRASGIKILDEGDIYNHGILEYLKGNYEKAVVDFEVAYEKKIKEASYYLGKISIEKEDYDAARLYFERYQKEAGSITLSGWYDGMALCEMKNEKYEAALTYVNKGLTLEDLSFAKNLLLKKIFILEKLNEYSKAYESTEEYLKLYSEDEAIKKENQFLKTRLRKKD